jgi:hypothetical protein
MPYSTDEHEFLQEQETRVKSYYATNNIKIVGFEKRERFIEFNLY